MKLVVFPKLKRLHFHKEMENKKNPIKNTQVFSTTNQSKISISLGIINFYANYFLKWLYFDNKIF